MKMLSRLLAILMVFAMTTPAIADGKELDALEKVLRKILPEGTLYTIDETPVAGLYQVDFGNTFIYMSADGKHVFKGDIIKIDNNENLTENKRASKRKKTISSLGDGDMITYAAGNKTDTLTIFTDIDCGYCRKLHNEMDEYNKRGIEIKYVFLPRAGVGSESYNKAVSVWCASDRNKALDKAKSGVQLEGKDCNHPVLKHMKVAEMLGVNSTPTLFMEDGSVLPGYVPAIQLEKILQRRKQLATSR